MGSIYKLSDGELNYYGSTIQPLNVRLSHHKCKSNDCLSRDLNKEKMTIELVEEVEDETQLKWRERYYMENNECVNKYLPVRGDEERKEVMKEYHKEYRIENKEYFRQKSEEYRNNNKEKLKECRIRAKEKIVECKSRPYHCVCGSSIWFSNKTHHFKTNKHKNYIKNII